MSATLEQQVANLTSQVEVLVARAKDDDDTFRELAHRINEYAARHENAIAAVHGVVQKEVAAALEVIVGRASNAIDRIHVEALNRFAADVATAAVQNIVVSKRVLLTRPAQRHELADVVPVRNAHRHEV